MVYRLSVKDVPVDGFWSVSVYNGKGYYEKNKLNAYTLNNITADKEARRRGQGAPAPPLRRQDRQLLARNEGLELHRPPLPPAPADPGWKLDISGTAAGQGKSE